MARPIQRAALAAVFPSVCFFLGQGLQSYSALSASEVELGGQVFTVEEGLAVEVAAAPPLVDRPITADLDEEGRLYVTESSGTNAPSKEQLEKKPHRALRLEDTDGDGRFDRRTIFAEGLMLPEGTLWHDGSLYVAAPPSIWKLTDRDGDGVAEERVEWFEGHTLTGCANDLHGPYLGRDGWIYWAKGAFAEQVYPREGRPPLVTRAAHLFRARTDGSGIEPVMTGGMDNPVDVVFSRGGERFFTTTFLQNPAGGKRDGLIHAVYGAVYGKLHDVIEPHLISGGILEPMTHLGPAAPCGLTLTESAALGPDHEGNLYAALFNLHKVTRHVLHAEGATYRTADSDLLASSSSDFHPTDVLEDADGSLLVVNTGGWYKLCCPTSQLYKPDVLGAIYRVRRAGAPAVADPRGKQLAWATLDATAEAQLLGDERFAVRKRAVARLTSRGEAAIPALHEAVASASATQGARTRDDRCARARVEAIWALTRLPGPAARAAVRAAIDGRGGDASLAAIHSAGLHRDAGAVRPLLAALSGGDPLHRRAAAEALGRVGDPAAVPPLLDAAASVDDATLTHSIIYALYEIGQADLLRDGLERLAPRARRAALFALQGILGPELEATLVIPQLAASDAESREAATWIARRHEDWGAALEGHLRKMLEAPLPATELAGWLAAFAREPRVQVLIGQAARGEGLPRTARPPALAAMRSCGLKEPPAAWAHAVLEAMEAGGDEVPAAIEAAAACAFPPEESGRLAQGLLGLAGKKDISDELRLSALRAVRPGLISPGEETLTFLRAKLDPAAPVSERAAALDTLERAKLEPAALQSLLADLKEVGPLELPRLLGLFEGVADEELLGRLLEVLPEAVGIGGLRADRWKAFLEKSPETVREQGQQLLSTLDQDGAARQERLATLLATLQEGDVRRGQAVFNSPRAACSSCHAIGYLGGTIGPDLTRIGQVRTETDLLEAVVFPSASFVRSYEPVVVVTRTGEVISGIPRGEGGAMMTIVAGPDKEARVPLDEVEEVRPGDTSIMPAGLDKLLTPQELADLVAFLKATRW